MEYFPSELNKKKCFIYGSGFSVSDMMNKKYVTKLAISFSMWDIISLTDHHHRVNF